MTPTSSPAGFDPMRAALQEALLRELPAGIERLRWPAERVVQHQRAGLRRLLRHAVRHSAFHRARLDGVDPDRFELDDLAGLPVMTKAEMMECLGDVYTDRRLSPELVEQALAATTTVPTPILGEYFALGTGGSSGRRATVVFDRRAAVQFVVSLTRPLAARLVAQGGPPPGGLRVAFVCAPSAVHATGSAPEWTAGGDLPFRFLRVPATWPLPRIVERLNALDAPGLAGYPTVLAPLAEERRAGRLRITPRMITSTSETLVPQLRHAIEDGFGAPIVDMFGSTEGLVGFSEPNRDLLTFNSDGSIIELVDENHRPVPPGVASAKVLITNLDNHLQPLIRYEMNDRFVRRPDSAERGYLRATVEGRADDVLHYADIDVHPVVLRHVFVTSPNVLDYQVHQTRRGVDVAALGTCGLDVAGLRDRLTRALEQAGLADPQVTMRPVDSLERHHETGKLQRFVPLRS